MSDMESERKWHRDDELTQLRADNARLKAEVEALRELHIMQLAGISTASIQNTESTIKDRINRENPYWTVAYGDVCTAIDREMNHRSDLQAHKAALEKARVALWHVEKYLGFCSHPIVLTVTEALTTINALLQKGSK